MTNPDLTELAGSCFCGALSFSVRAPTKWCGHCHCSMCRRIHGSGVVTWVGCHESSVSFPGGDEYLKWYESSPGAMRGSCKKCGSQMFFKSGRWPDELHITRANFHGEIDREPSGHSFFDTHVDWLQLVD